jgi:hypothetical protein
MPSAAVRFAIEAAFLVLVALGAVLAELEPIVIVALVAVSTVLVAVVERSYRREAARAAVASDEAAEPEPDQVETPKDAVREEPEPVAEGVEPAVSERSARAILATGPPPVVEPSPPEAEHVDEPEPERVAERPSQEWNIWELERLVRDHPDDRRREEWSALVLSLREFAGADGALPAEFDELVWETFGATLVSDAVATEATAAP